MQVLFGFSLKKEGYEVLKAMNGLEGIKILEEQIPDAIISDIMMPEMDGFEFRRQILNHPKWSDIPFLFLSAYDNEKNIITGIELEAEDFIPKTDGANVVVSKLKNALRKRNTIKQQIVGEMDQASRATGVLLKPPKPPALENFTIHQYQKSHEDIPGGDFLDYVDLGDDLLIIMGDVMGKRWRAWVFAHAYAGYIRSTVRAIASGLSTEVNPSEVLRRLNTAIHDDDQVTESICALTLISLNKKSGRVKLSNALQYPLVYFNASKGKAESIQMNSSLLGLSPRGEFEQVELTLHSGDCLLAATDGVTEAAHGGGTSGFDVMLETLQELALEERISAGLLVETVLRRVGLAKPNDDATVIIIEAKKP